MSEKSPHPLKFLSGFEDSRPDAYHHVDAVYAEKWIRGKYICRSNIYKSSLYINLLRKEYSQPGFRDIYLIAEKKRPD